MGDYARAMPPHSERGVGALFDMVNRGKRSVALDLKTSAGRDVIHELVGTADVLIEGFRPGVTERLGIDDETVRKHNDDIMYCSLTGCGRTGPDADRAGHDLNHVGAAGLLDMTRRSRDEAPRIPGYSVGDMAGETFAALGVLGALCSRELGNTAGEHLDIAMTDVVLSFSQLVAHGALTGESPRPGETPLTGGLPWYDVYETADGRYVTLAALEPKFWAAFCTAVDHDELTDEHGTDDPATREALRETLEAVFAARTQAEWEADLGAIDATVGPVHTPAEAVDSPQVGARGVIETADDAPRRIGFPARSSAPSDGVPESVPAHGEHTEAVLREHGFGTAIERLRADDVIV